MKRFAFKTLVVFIMLSSLLGQAFAMSFNPALIKHDFEHEGVSQTNTKPASGNVISPDFSHHDHDYEHDGEFNDVEHDLLHAAHHIQLFSAPDFPVLHMPEQVTPIYVISFSPFIETSPEPLFRPPRRSFAS